MFSKSNMSRNLRMEIHCLPGNTVSHDIDFKISTMSISKVLIKKNISETLSFNNFMQRSTSSSTGEVPWTIDLSYT